MGERALPLVRRPGRAAFALPLRLPGEHRVRRAADGARRELGFGAEIEWLREILGWPLEWSALHGIAEIKTPVLRASARTDATPRKYVVRWEGESYPEGGASGLSFPYPRPGRPKLTASAAFGRGLRHSPEVGETRPPWYWRDNGFDSLQSMAAAHAPLIELAREGLRDREGMVLDLGCGNGALLQKLCPAGTGLVPCGVDSREASIRHAKALCSDSADHFLTGDLFEHRLWPGHGDRYLLTLLMVGRLLEKPSKARDLLAAIQSPERSPSALCLSWLRR